MANNTTIPHPTMAKPHTVECVVLMLCCVVSITANIFVMALIIIMQRLKTSTNIFVFSLCLCNSIISLVVIPMRTFIENSEIYAMLAYKYIVIITILIYICNLTAVSRHRLRCIIRPMTHLQTQTKSQVIKIVALTWFGPLVYGLLPVIWFKLQEMSSIEKIVHDVYKLVTVVLLLAPLVFMVFVFFKVYRQAKNIRENEQIPSAVALLDLSNELNRDGIEGRGRFSCKNFGIDLKGAFSKIVSPFVRDELKKNAKLSNGSTKAIAGLPAVHLISPSPESQRASVVSLPGQSKSIPNLPRCGSMSLLSPYKRNEKCCSIQSLASCGVISTEHHERDMNNSNCLSPEHVGNMLRRAKAASSASLSSLSSRASICTLQKVVRRKVYEIKASLAFFIVALGYMVTWVPVVALTMIDIVDRELYIPRYVEIISLYTISFNALVDPFLYGLLLPSFRRTLRLSLRRRRDRQSIRRLASVKKGNSNHATIEHHSF